MNKKERLLKLAESFIGAWNTQDVERVVATYTPDVQYRDPNTNGFVMGSDAMRKYLAKLFTGWDMHWAVRELYPFDEIDGAAVLWHAKLKRKGKDKVVEVDGMDLVLVEGNLIKRNDVYFDRAVMAPLFEK
ncbi:MAG: nuclear transport factor 2 family protein [Syntrophales bacterium]|jgi:ketosteroid isomerase-like protein